MSELDQLLAETKARFARERARQQKPRVRVHLIENYNRNWKWVAWYFDGVEWNFWRVRNEFNDVMYCETRDELEHDMRETLDAELDITVKFYDPETRSYKTREC